MDASLSDVSLPRPAGLRARDNPFAVSRIQAIRYRWTEAEWAVQLARLASMRYRGAVVGPPGSGKTTLLEDLAARLRRAGWRTYWLQLTEEQPRLTPQALAKLRAAVGASDMVLLDGAEQMPWWRWVQLRCVCRTAGGLIVTSHRPGRLPTWHACATTSELFRDLVAELAPELARSGEVNFSEVLARHPGNIRDALRALYDRCARWPTGHVRR